MTEQKALTINGVADRLSEMLTKHAEALPRGFNQTRFLQNTLTVLNDTKHIDKCNPVSVARTVIKGAYLGLDFFRRECYAIPYMNKETGLYELNFQTDYKGEIKLVQKYSVNPITDIYAKIVREGDQLDLSVKYGKQCLHFTPKLFNDGPILGVFAVAVFAYDTLKYEAMGVQEIEAVRKHYSKNADGDVWVKSKLEMSKKVAIRRLCKTIPLEFENAQQDAAFEEGSDLKLSAEPKPPQIKDPFEDAEDAEIVTTGSPEEQWAIEDASTKKEGVK